MVKIDGRPLGSPVMLIVDDGSRGLGADLDWKKRWRLEKDLEKELETEVARLEDLVSQLEAELAGHKQGAAASAEQMAVLETTLAEHKQEAAASEAAMKQLRTEVAALAASSAGAKEAARDEICKLQGEVELARIATDEEQKAKDAALNMQAKLQLQMDELQASSDAALQLHTQLHDAALAKDGAMASLRAELDAALDAACAAQAQKEAMVRDVEAAQQKIAELHVELDTVREEQVGGYCRGFVTVLADMVVWYIWQKWPRSVLRML